MNKTDRLKNNNDILKSLLDGQKIKKTNQYTGFGGLSEILHPQDIENQKIKTEIDRLYSLSKELDKKFKQDSGAFLNSIKNSVLTAFYTPQEVIRPVYEALNQKGFIPESFLDPCAGMGAFYEALPDSWQMKKLNMVEKDMATAMIMQSIYGKSTVKAIPFEKYNSGKDFDLIASNIPFNEAFVNAPEYPGYNLHNFFIKKSLDLLTNQGIGVFIAPIGVSDSPANRAIREHIVENHTLVGMFRLPNTVFANSHTSACSDVIIIQKGRLRALKEHELAFCSREYATLDEAGKAVNYNLYYGLNLSHLIGIPFIKGQYSGNDFDLAEDKEKKVSEQLSDALKNVTIVKKQPVQMRKKTFQKQHETVPIVQRTIFDVLEEQKPVPIHDPGDISEFASGGFNERENASYFNIAFAPKSLWLHEGRAGYTEVKIVDGEKEYTFEPLYEQKEVLLDYLKLKKSFLILIEFDRKNRENDPVRHTLNILYDKFVEKHGALHENNKFLGKHDSVYSSIAGLERQENGNWVKTDVFFQNTILHEFNAEDFINKSIYDVLLHVYSRKLKADLNEVSQITGKTYRDCYQELKDYVFYDPQRKETVLREEYLSGKIADKIAFLQQYLEITPDLTEAQKEEYQRNLQALEESRPIPLQPADIEFVLGQRWIPKEIYELFINEKYNRDYSLLFLSGADYFRVQRIHWERKIHGYPLSDVLSACFNGQSLTVREKDPITERSVTNVAKTKNLQLFQANVKKDFKQWIVDHPAIEKNLVDKYNELYNSIVERSYPPMLQFEDLKHYVPRDFQNSAVYQNLIQLGGYNAHPVGAGKTLTMAITIMRAKELKLANKPLLLCLKSNILSIELEFRRAYPDAKLLVADERNFTSDKRQEFFIQAATGNWDCVIMTHDNYLAIPHNHETQRIIIDETLQDIEDTLQKMIDMGDDNRRGMGRLYKGLEKRKESALAKLKRLETEKDHTLCFQSIGFDFLIVDEADVFKNLEFHTRLDSVAGLNSSGSKRATELLHAVRSIQKYHGDERGILFASGTPISNSVAEMFIIFKYLIPETIKQKQIHTFDAFKDLFITITSDYELTTTGEVKLKSRMNEYINLPDLCRLFKSVAHVVTSDDMQESIKGLPDDHRTLKIIESSSLQQELTAGLQLAIEYENWDYLGLPEYKQGMMSEEDVMAKMLLACSISNKIATDMRLLSLGNLQPESPKITELVKNILSYYFKFKEEKGVQLVFLDQGTPTTKGFNLYEDIKNQLSELGVSESDIAFIHDHKTGIKKQALFDRVNAGEIRILMGSTGTMGAGVNVQQRVVAMHQVECPWRPRDLTQRAGRGVRQGNLLGKEYGVDHFFYAVKNTLDQYRYQVVAIKEKFINQILSNKLGSRKLSQDALGQDDDQVLMTYADFVALLSGDSRLLEKVKLEKEIDMIEVEKKQFEQDRRTAQLKKDMAISSIQRTKGSYENAEKDSKNAASLLEYFRNNEVSSIITDPDGKEILGSKEVGTRLKNICYQLIAENPFQELQDTGCKAGNFHLHMKRTPTTQYYRLVLKGEMTYGTDGERGDVKSEPAQLGLYVNDCLQQAERYVNGLRKYMAQDEEIIMKSDEILNQTFSKKDRLEELDEKLFDLVKNIEVNPPKNFLDPIKKKIEHLVDAGRTYRLGYLDQDPNMVEVYGHEEKILPLKPLFASRILQKGMEVEDYFENQNWELKQ